MDDFGLTKYMNSFEFRDSNVLKLISILMETKTITYEDAQSLKTSYYKRLEEIEDKEISEQDLKDYLTPRLKEGFDISRIWSDFDKEKLNEDHIYDCKSKYDKKVIDKIVGAMKEILINN